MTSHRLGLTDFLAMTSEFHPEWSIFAAQGSPEQVHQSNSARYPAPSMGAKLLDKSNTIVHRCIFGAGFDGQDL